MPDGMSVAQPLCGSNKALCWFAHWVPCSERCALAGVERSDKKSNPREAIDMRNMLPSPNHQARFTVLPRGRGRQIMLQNARGVDAPSALAPGGTVDIVPCGSLNEKGVVTSTNRPDCRPLDRRKDSRKCQNLPPELQ